VNGPNLDSDMPIELLEVTAGKRLPLSIPQLQTGAVLRGTQCGLDQQNSVPTQILCWTASTTSDIFDTDPIISRLSLFGSALKCSSHEEEQVGLKKHTIKRD
jgi:hypothetical protein